MLVSCDAAQLEWRTLAELARDPVAMEEIAKGLDTHSLNQAAFELPSRLIAKIYLFRTIYRGSGWAFANDPAFMHVSKDPKFWDAIGEKFYTKYGVISQTHLAWSESVVRGEPIMGPFGRVWEIPMGRDNYGNVKIPWTVLTNYPVQGTGADVMMIARISFARRLRTLGIPVLLISTVHDSIVVDAEKKYVSQVANLFYQVFDDLVTNIRRTFKYDWQVPLGCEVKAGMDMKNMKLVDRTDKL
jgi:DNA polymerase-1